MLQTLLQQRIGKRIGKQKPNTGGIIAPDRYDSLGDLLRDALVQFKSETALIEANRKREVQRLSYLDFKREALTVARLWAEKGLKADDRVAILMSNQPRWLLAAYAVFHRGGVLVPLDYKLDEKEQAALLAHAKPTALVIEYSIYRKLAEHITVPLVLVSEAPEGAELGEGAIRWEELVDVEGGDEPALVQRKRDDVATIVYSSGTGGRPKGCMLTHDNYLAQYESLGALYPLVAGDRYFSILPTNHAIDFMCGFVGPLCGGATVVHQRSLRPEFINWTMKSYGVTHMAIVPLILEAFERKIHDGLDEQPHSKRAFVEVLAGINESLTARKPNWLLSRNLLGPIHEAFGGKLKMLFCGGAFVDKERAELFYRLGIPVAIGYGLTEACTVATVNDLKPFRADSVGAPVEGVEIEIVDANEDGIGEVRIKGRTVMKGYLEDPELTAETIRDGWLYTGDLGWMDASEHLHLVGRSKNMIVTAGGKNVYPEDIEAAFEGVPAEELVVFASNALWPGGKLSDEVLVAVARVEDDGQADDLREELSARNSRLPEYKRVAALLLWDDDFPRTASMKVKRGELGSSLQARTERGDLTEL